MREFGRANDYQTPLLFFIISNLIAVILLYINDIEKKTDVFLYAAIIIGAIFLFSFIINFFDLGDSYLFQIMGMLMSLGLVMLYRIDPDYAFRQVTWLGIGLAVFFAAYFIYSRIAVWSEYPYIYPVLSFTLFLATMLFGSYVKGAKNWIFIGGYSFQPSELIKLLFVFFLASYQANPEKFRITFGGKSYSPKYALMMIVFMYFGMMAVQREFGTALLLFLIYICYLYVFSDNIRFKIANFAFFVCFSLASVKFVHHVQVRIDSWLNPWADVAGRGYQITQSLFALGAGGFFGTGIASGNPYFIPEVRTDFIFSAICEEMGIFGGIAVILLYFLFAYRGIKIALRITDTYHKCIAFGITLMFAFQSFIIIGGVIKLIPLTGITLPFISYGGSSLLVCFLSLGILQAISGKVLRNEVNLKFDEKH